MKVTVSWVEEMFLAATLGDITQNQKHMLKEKEQAKASRTRNNLGRTRTERSEYASTGGRISG